MGNNFICINNIYLLFDELVEITLRPVDCSMEIMYYQEAIDNIETETFYFEDRTQLRQEYNRVISQWKGINVLY
ncbi:MAG: hypothetical protein EHM58_08955 [Ignavibacteriae bacterium]|nr:MAG: hypothetical protein EHM58_08955 [Ignavibacteriota bacterium]